MYETITLDSNTIIIKSDDKEEISDIIKFISKNSKENNMKIFLETAHYSRKQIQDYNFIRGECYD